MTNNKLSTKTKVGAGIADLGGNVFFSVINFWLMYYMTDMVGISAAAAGISIMIGKMWDAVTDPLMGYISDNTTGKRGRRRPYMVIGLLPLALSFVAFFTKVEIGKPMLLCVYYTMLYCLINTFYTIIFVPYYSLLNEITKDYHERTSLQSVRMLFALLGNIVGSVLAQPIIGLFPNERVGFTGMAVIFSAVIAAAVMVTVLTTREPTAKSTAVKVRAGSFFRSYFSVFKNKPYRITVTVMTLCFFSLVVSQTTVPYFFKYYLGQEEMATLGILAAALGCIAGIPFVLYMSKRHGKKNAWIAEMFIALAGSLAVYIVAPMGVLPVVIAFCIFGLGSAGTYVLLMSVVADCADSDYAETGEKKEGLFVGSTTFLQKLGMALGAAVVGWVLNGLGYIADQPQPEPVMNGIRILQTLLPLVLNAAAMAILFFYPITEEKFDEIKKKIALLEQSKTE